MENNYNGPEKRIFSLSDEDVEKIANRAKELALQELYISVGRSVVSKGLWVISFISAAVAAYLGFTGHFSK